MQTGNKDTQRTMDDTLENSFPASDPPSWSTPHGDHQEKQGKREKDGTKARPKGVRQHFSKKDYMADDSKAGSRHH